jgi:hypothetical protein
MKQATTIVSLSQAANSVRNTVTPGTIYIGPVLLQALGFMASLRGAAVNGNSVVVMAPPALLIRMQAEKFRPPIGARLLTL